jgi:probable HAF family extracellular repeat protein
VVTDLGRLPGGGESDTIGINDRRSVIGVALTSGGVYHAGRWSRSGTITDLSASNEFAGRQLTRRTVVTVHSRH